MEIDLAGVSWPGSAGLGFQKGSLRFLARSRVHTPVKACQPVQKKKEKRPMSDPKRKKETRNISPQPDDENKKRSQELSEEELKEISGGGGTPVPSGPVPIPYPN